MCTPALLAARYHEVLTHHLGLETRPTPEEDGSLVFTHQGLNILWTNPAPGDPEFLHLAVPFTLDPTHYDTDHVPTVAADITRRFKGVKAIPTSPGVVFTLEAFLAPPATIPTTTLLTAVLPRALRALHHAIDSFHTDLTFHTITLLTPDSDPESTR